VLEDEDLAPRRDFVVDTPPLQVTTLGGGAPAAFGSAVEEVAVPSRRKARDFSNVSVDFSTSCLIAFASAFKCASCSDQWGFLVELPWLVFKVASEAPSCASPKDLRQSSGEVLAKAFDAEPQLPKVTAPGDLSAAAPGASPGVHPSSVFSWKFAAASGVNSGIMVMCCKSWYNCFASVLKVRNASAVRSMRSISPWSPCSTAVASELRDAAADVSSAEAAAAGGEVNNLCEASMEPERCKFSGVLSGCISALIAFPNLGGSVAEERMASERSCTPLASSPNSSRGTCDKP
jgi:hypothetical protein